MGTLYWVRTQIRGDLLFSQSVMSNSNPMDCSTPGSSLGACSNSCSLSQWCHLTISSFVVPFCLQSFPASGSFLMSQLFTSGGQNIGASASVLPMNIQGWFPLGLTGFILLSKGLSRVFSNTSSKASILWCSAFMVQLSHPYMTTGKTIALTITDLCWQSNVSAP